MPYQNLPSYVVAVNVKLSGVNQANVQVTLRNERTGNSTNLTTDSSGDVVFDAANISGGVAVDDVLTAFSFYTNYEASVQHTVTSGGTSLNLSLSAVPASDALRYFTVQQFYESFGYPLNDNNTELIKSIEVIRVGLQIEQQIDEFLGSKFDSNSGSYYTKTEYLDTYELNDTYFLSAVPVVTLSSVRTTQSDEDTAPNIDTGTWTTLTSNTDFVTDLTTGRIIIVTAAYKPITRKNGLYASYTYGKATVPQDIRRLAILMTMYHFSQGSILKNRVMGRSTGSTQDLSLVKQEIDSIINQYKLSDQYSSP